MPGAFTSDHRTVPYCCKCRYCKQGSHTFIIQFVIYIWIVWARASNIIVYIQSKQYLSDEWNVLKSKNGQYYNNSIKCFNRVMILSKHTYIINLKKGLPQSVCMKAAIWQLTSCNASPLVKAPSTSKGTPATDIKSSHTIKLIKTKFSSVVCAYNCINRI